MRGLFGAYNGVLCQGTPLAFVLSIGGPRVVRILERPFGLKNDTPITGFQGLQQRFVHSRIKITFNISNLDLDIMSKQAHPLTAAQTIINCLAALTVRRAVCTGLG